MSRAAPVRHVDPASLSLSPTARAMMDAGLLQRPAPAAPSGEIRWHPAYVSPTARSPDRVEEFVTRLGFASWWPKLTTVHKRPLRGVPVGSRGGKRWTQDVQQRPLWPRYILVALPREDPPFGRLSDDHARAFGLYGVIQVGAGPAVVPKTVVDELQRREAAGEWDRTARRGRKVVERPPDWATLGGTVEVTDGPFASFHAVVEELVGDRARVAVSIFGRSTPVDVHLSQLRGRS